MSSSQYSGFTRHPTDCNPEAAYLYTLAELEAVGAQRLLPINLDVTSVTTRVLGVLPTLRSLTGQLQFEIAGFEAQLADRRRRYAMALQHAHSLYGATSSQRETVAPLAEALAAERRSLLVQARPLVLFGLVDPEVIERTPPRRSFQS